MKFFLLSFLIVAFGQAAWSSLLAFFAAFFGYALFWKQYRGNFLAGSLWFTFVQLFQLSWMTSIEFQGIYILGVWLGIALWLGLQFGIITYFLKSKLSFFKILMVASFWTLIEWLRLHILCGFSFNPVGLALSSNLQSMQFAAVFGILGLSFWVMFVNLSILSKRIFLGSAMGAIPYFFGFIHLHYHEHEKEKTASVALVQTGLLPSEKTLLPGRSQSYISPLVQWQRIISFLNETTDQDWDLIVLPEAVVPFAAEDAIYPFEVVKNILSREGIHFEKTEEDKVSNLFWIKSLATHFQADLIAGLDGRDVGKNYFAAGYHLRPGDENHNRYEKRILVPLAEYIPFSWLKPLVASYGIMDFFTHGLEAKVFEGKVPFSLSICYEETFPDLIRENRQKGAELFINLTNDNWYPFSKLPEQHFSLGILRTVENGVPLLRSCNSGITAAVDSLGRVKDVFREKSGVLSTKIDLYTYKTLYTFWGDGGIISFSLFWLAFCIRYKEIFRFWSS